MAFLAPVMLVGLIGISVPIIIHLLERSRNVPQEFPTLRLLMAAQQQSSRRTKLRNLIVLFLRCLLIALLVLAMAQPYTQDETWARPPELPTTLVIVLDNSYSMAYRDGADVTTRFDRAKQMAMEQVAALAARDEVALVLANDVAEPITERPTRDHERVIELIQRAELSYAPGDMRDAVGTAFALSQLDALSEAEERELEEAEEAEDAVDEDTGVAAAGPRRRREAWRQVMVVSDMQRTAWRDVVEDDLIAELYAGLGEEASVPVTLADLSTPTASNRFIRRVEVGEDPTGGLLNVTIDVAAHGPSRPRGGQARLFLNDERAGSPELLPGGDGEVTLRADLPAPGVHAGRVEMEEDRLAVDDVAHFAVNVTGGRELIVVDGRPSRTPGRAGAFFLNAALEIRQQGSPRPLNITERTPRELSTQPLPDGGALLLMNVERLDGSALTHIEDFLRAGGNVFIALGDQVDVDHYNDNWTFLPAPLTGRRGDPGRSQAFGLITQEPDHPILAEGIDLSATRFFAFLGVDDERLRHDARVLARFVDESPALVEGFYAGEDAAGGRVVLLAGPMDARWSNFPMRRAYVPFVDQLVSHLTRQRIAARMVTLGEPVRFAGAAALEGEPVTITTPGDATQTLRADLDARGARALAAFRGTQVPGVYRVEADPAFEGVGAGGSAFAVNLDTRGSIVTPIDRDALRAAFGDRPVRFVRDDVAAALGGWHADEEAQLGEQRREWWPWLLLAALGVFVLESLLANYFTRRPAVTAAGTQFMETRRTDALAGHAVEQSSVPTGAGESG